MKKLKLSEKIFSVTHCDRKHKQICLLGVKVKYKRGWLEKYKKQPIQNNKIVFDNFNGNSYGCNPKYIADEIIRRKLPYDLVWICKNLKSEDFPENIRVVKHGSKKAFQELMTAKVWVDNYRKTWSINRGLTKREGQCYIQTWHGSFGIKKLDKDVVKFNMDENKIWLDAAHIDADMMDYLITNCSWEDQILGDALWFDHKICQYGHARNDIFYKDSTVVKNKVRELYNISENKKICLYVPSFRDNGKLYPFIMEYKNLLKNLKERFGSEFILMIRMHPRYEKYADKLVPAKEYIIDVSKYPDIQELLVTADVAITDYSSCIFDFMLQRKPAFIFASDQDEFDEDRGFYYPLRATPFPVAEDNEELKQNILNFDLAQYQQKVDEFLADKGCMEDGHAAERVVDLIEKIINGEANV